MYVRRILSISKVIGEGDNMTNFKNTAPAIILHNVERNEEANRSYFETLVGEYIVENDIELEDVKIIEFNEKKCFDFDQVTGLTRQLIHGDFGENNKAIVVLGSYLTPKEHKYYGNANFFNGYKGYFDIYCLDYEGNLYRRVKGIAPIVDISESEE